jgi:hypothetical protein
MIASQDAGRAAITTSDIANAIAFRDSGRFGDESDELQYRFFGTLPAGSPEAVMDVFSPDLAVKLIEIIVMSRDGRVLQIRPRHNHREEFPSKNPSDKLTLIDDGSFEFTEESLCWCMTRQLNRPQNILPKNGAAESGG